MKKELMPLEGRKRSLNMPLQKKKEIPKIIIIDLFHIWLYAKSNYEWLQGKGVYQFVDKYGANVDGYRYFFNSECYF
jgi:Photosystem II 10 kDa polypeptide PsbR